LSPSITNKVDLQPYLSFDEVCNLAIILKRQLEGRKSFETSLTKSFSTHIEIETLPLEIKALDKGKRIGSEPFKKLKGRDVSTVMVMAIFEVIVLIKGPCH